MLVEDGIAPIGWVEDPEVEGVIEPEEEEGHPKDGGRDHQDDTSSIDPPDEEGEAHPLHPLGPHRMRRHDEVQPRDRRGDPEDEDPEDDRGEGHRSPGTIGWIEGPACIGAPDEGPDEDDDTTQDIEV